MSGRFTLAGLLMGVTFVALVLAIVVPTVRYARRVETLADSVVSVAASADGSAFAALMGDGRVLIWDKVGSFKGSLQTGGTFGAELAISSEGKLVAVSPGDVWEVSTREVWRTLGTSVKEVVFSPTEERIAVVNHASSLPAQAYEDRGIQFQQQGAREPIYEVYTMTHDGRPRMISKGHAPAFSPDGKRLAVAVSTRGRRAIDIYDVANGSLERSLAQSICNRLRWAPDGRRLANLFSPHTVWGDPTDVFIDIHDLVREVARSGVVPGEKWDGGSHTLVYLPDGKSLLVGAVTRGFKAFDADTLCHVAEADLSKVWHAAAGTKGDAFVAAESHAVDLWDAATLRPRRRLFDAAPPPDRRLPICGLVIWVIAFVVRRRAKTVQSVQPAAKALWHPAPSGALT